MKSNNEIVTVVYKQYNIPKLCKTMIAASRLDQSCDDLSSYIYEKLLQMDNTRLNTIFNNNKLRNFCSQIIARQRNGAGGGSEYTLRLKIHEKPLDQYPRETPDEPYDYQPDLIMNYISEKSEYLESNNYSKDQINEILSFNILHKYLTSNLSMRHLAVTLHMNRMVISKLINSAKEKTTTWFLEEGQYQDATIIIKNKYEL